VDAMAIKEVTRDSQYPLPRGRAGRLIRFGLFAA
jgi:hypothetical protein